MFKQTELQTILFTILLDTGQMLRQTMYTLMMPCP